MRPWGFALAALCVVTSAASAQEQKYQRGDAEQFALVPIERFSAPLPARRNPALAGARVVFRHWNITNDQRVEIPHQGFLVVHVHSGDIMVTVDGTRTERHGDEFFTVPPGVRLIVETSRDSVVLRTLDTITP
jgi:hypothetical protein